ncbi:MAG: hypothetical protein IPF59_00685 [Ignavibacteria bacterium]|nr:hypothetical protein [Ignavibacteria bacterium]
MLWTVSSQARTLLIVVLLSASSSFGWAQDVKWEKEYLDLDHAKLLSVVITASNRIVAVGDNAVVKVGSSLTGLLAVYGHRNSGSLRSVFESKSGLLVAVGDDPFLLTSSDGGTTWKRRPISVSHVTEIAINDNDNSVLLSAADGLYHANSIDETLTKSAAGEFTSVVWTSQDDAIAGSTNGDVLTTVDGGKNWIRNARLSSSMPVLRIRSYRSQVVIVREQNLTMAMTGGDTSEIVIEVNPYIKINDAFAMGDTLIAVGFNIGATHMFSTDSGKTWETVDINDSDANWAIGIRSNQFAIVGGVGTYRLGSTDTLPGKSFARKGFGTGNIQPSILSFRSATGGDSRYLCLQNSSGARVLEFTDSSRVVTNRLPLDLGRGTSATDIFALSDTIIVVADSFKVITEGNVSRASYRHQIFSSTDGGSNWSTLLAPTWDARLQWISRSWSGQVFLTGGEAAYRFDLLSNSTFKIVCSELAYVTSLVASSDKMLAVGNSLCLSIDAGTSWTVLPAPFAASNVRRLVQASEGRIIAFETSFQTGVGGELNIWTTDDWGSQWTKTGQFNSDAKIDPFDFDVKSPGCILAADQTAMVHYSTDNGSSWRVDSPPIDRIWNLYGAQWIDTETIRVCGDNEYIFRGKLDKSSGVSGIKEPIVMKVVVYPNPGSVSVSASIDGRTITSVDVYDALLRQMNCVVALQQERAVVNIGALPNGHYTLIVHTTDGIVSASVVKQ